MSQTSSAPAAREPTAAAKPPAERVVHDIRRATRKQHAAEDGIRIVLEGLRGERALPRCAAVRALRRACTTPGPRSSSQPGSAA
jgi:transposase